MESGWQFMDFAEPDGRNYTHDELHSLSVKARAEINSRILAMSTMPKWPLKWTKKYQALDGVFELRICFGNVQYRPLVMYGPKERQITILIVAIEKTKIPKKDLETATKRKKMIERDPKYAKEHDFN